MKIDVLKKMISLINQASERRNKEHEEFLDFLETLVVAAGPEVSKQFGRLSVRVNSKDGAKNAGIELTPADLFYWREAILQEGQRFIQGASAVKLEIFNRLTDSAESHKLSPEERQEFIRLMKVA